MKYDETDPQQVQVYQAEDDSGLCRTVQRFKTVREANEWAYAVVEQEGGSRRFAGVQVRGNGSRSSHAKIFAEEFTIHVSPTAKDAYTILHEIAHGLVEDPPLPPHGTLFCATILRLTRTYLGFHAYGALKAAFDLHDVSY